MTAPAPGGRPADSAFGRMTALQPLGDGRYACDLDPGWSTLAGINGGVMMALLTGAIDAELADPERQLRSLTVHFMRPPRAGAAEIVVEPLRVGARAANLRLRLEQHGKTMLEALAVVFAGGMREVARWLPEPPDVPGPGSEPLFADPRGPAIVDYVRFTPVLGPRPLAGERLAPGEAARTAGWLELEDPHPITPAVVAMMADVWWPAALGAIDVMSFYPTIDFTLHLRTRLPAGGLPPQPLLIDVTTAASAEGFIDDDVRLYAEDGTLLAQARQLAITMTPEDRAPVTRDAPLERG